MARILEEYEHDIDSVELVTGTGGIFDVHVDGELVFEKKMIGRHPQPDDVLPLLAEKLG